MYTCSVQAVATQGCDEFVHCSLPLLNKQFCLWVPPCLFVGLKFCGPSGRRRATATTKHCALQRLEASPDRAHREKDPRRALRRTAVRKFGRSLAARSCVCCDSQGLRVGELVESLFVAARSIHRWPPRERTKAFYIACMIVSVPSRVSWTVSRTESTTWAIMTNSSKWQVT